MTTWLLLRQYNGQYGQRVRWWEAYRLHRLAHALRVILGNLWRTGPSRNGRRRIRVSG
jgi:hypothetical protein